MKQLELCMNAKQASPGLFWILASKLGSSQAAEEQVRVQISWGF
jgi:hypothetical protein